MFRTDKKLMPSFDLIPISIELARENIWTLFYLSFLPSIIIAVGQVMLQSAHGKTGSSGTVGIAVLLLLIGVIYNMLTSPGLLVMQIAAARGSHLSPSQSFRTGLKFFWRVWLASLLIGILVLLGFICLIVPGLILVRRYYLTLQFAVGDGLPATQAMAASRNASEPIAGYIWGTIGVAMLFGLAGLLLQAIPVVGILLSIAVSYIFVFATAIRFAEVTDSFKLPQELEPVR